MFSFAIDAGSVIKPRSEASRKKYLEVYESTKGFKEINKLFKNHHSTGIRHVIGTGWYEQTLRGDA